MNAVEMLIQQHREMEAALEEALALAEDGRKSAFTHAADQLMSHVKMEEHVFYPAVTAKRTHDALLESVEEHLSLKRLVADLVSLPAADAHFEPKLHVLKEQTEHHHKEEEEKLFPEVRKLFTGAELDALGNEMQRYQDKLLAGDPRYLAESETEVAASIR